MAATGAADGEYPLGSLSVVVRNGEARLASTGAIAASTATLASSLRYATSMAAYRCPTPSRRSPRPRPRCSADGVGPLAPGAYADLVELSDELEVNRVMRRGAWVPLS